MSDNNLGPNFNFTPPQQPYPVKTNGKAIAALVLGILSIILPYIGIIIGIVAIILGAIALKEIKATATQGRGLAIAGLVCGIVGVALYALIILFIIVALVMFDSAGSNSYSDFGVAFNMISSTLL